MDRGRCEHKARHVYTEGIKLGHGLLCHAHTKGHFTPRGRANSLCKRLMIFTCDWLKG